MALLGRAGPDGPALTLSRGQPTRHRGVAAMTERVAAMSPKGWLPWLRNPGSHGPKNAIHQALIFFDRNNSCSPTAILGWLCDEATGVIDWQLKVYLTGRPQPA